MQQAIKTLQENTIPVALKKIERLKLQNEGALVLLSQINNLYQSQREEVCKWIVSIEQISIEYKFQAYNILGCTLEEEGDKILNFKNALHLGLKYKFDISDPMINLSKIYLRQKEYQKILSIVKYLNQCQRRHKIVALHILAKANLGLNQMNQCEEYSKQAFLECKKLYGNKDAMTLRLQEYLNLLSLNQGLNQDQYTPNQQNESRSSLQSRQSAICLDLGKTFTQFQFKIASNSIQSEHFNNQEIMVEFCYQNRKTNTLKNQKKCCELINIFFQYADITIIIKNIDQNSDCSQQIQVYQDLFNKIEDGNEEPQDYLPQIQIQSDENSNNNIFTYQLQEQNENNISQLDKMIYIQKEFIQNFLIQSTQKDISFKLDEKLFQYQIRSGSIQQRDETSDFFEQFKKILDKIVVLTFNCENETAASSIINKLNQKKIYKNITQKLKIENLILMLSSDINLKDFQLYNRLLGQAQYLKQQTNQIILIGMFIQPFNIAYLQKQFSEFVQKSQNLRLVRKKDEIELAFDPDPNVIDQQIKQLQQKEEQFEISVSQPQLKVGIKKMFVVDLIIEYWMDSINQQVDEVQKLLEKVKNQILEIFFPSQQINLNDEKQIKLWENILKQLHTQNHKESCTINTQLVIELKGESKIIDEKKQLILSDLMQYQHKKYNFEVEEKIAKILAKKQNLKNLFKASLGDISTQYDTCQIQIAEVNDNRILVDAYVDDQTKLFKIQKELQKNFFEQLSLHIEKNFEIEDLYNFLGMQKQEFKFEYQVEVSKIDKEWYFICQKQFMDLIKQLIELTKEYQKEIRKTDIIPCQNILVFNEFKEQYSQQQTTDGEYMHINFSQNQKIALQSTNPDVLKEKSNQIKSNIQKLESQLINQTFIFQEKQIKFFKKNFKLFFPNVETEKKATIKFQTTQFSFISSVQQQNKKLHLVQADITLLECDAIVNFHCSEKQLHGLSRLTQSILDLGGQKYQNQFHGNLKNSNPLQNQFDITIHELSSFRNIRFIVNLVIPSQCKMDFNNPQSIQQIIHCLFNHIQKQQEITRLAIPIFNIFNNNCQEQIQSYLNSIMDKLFNSEHPVRQIYVTEINEKKIKFAESVLSQISQVSIYCPQKFQWQWQDTNKFVNYNEDVNKQINDAYNLFVKENIEVAINLKFQIENKPSTHSVDLKQLKITELQSKQEQQIIFKQSNYKISYIINNKVLDEELTQYFINMYNKKCFTFQIFWKELVVVINNQQTYQLNKQTRYQRTIQKIPHPSDIMESKQRISSDTSQILECQNQIVIQSFDTKLNNMILEEIKQKLQESLLSLNITIPQFNNVQEQKFIEYLETVAQRVKGRIISGQTINIEIFKNKEKNVFKQLDLIKSYSKKEYPQEWSPQNENFIKVKLEQNSQEYIKIKTLFQKTDQGTIVAIFRIQNIILWDSYIIERNKLLDYYKKQQSLLLPQEQKRYLWHGVSGRHPSVIYKSQTEAFDVSYSNVGLWGAGIYFAENASYSRNYSCQIQNQDDPQYAGNRVFLCCLVTTGKLDEREQSRDIKRPKDGCDCVTGITGGSQIFVIYQMHVRRAYPAYEVIFN